MVLLNWILVVVVCGVSAYYLNWIAYGPTSALDGSIKAVLTLGLQWYVPVVVLVQLSIWYAMPRLMILSSSPWIAAMIWVLLSALCKVVTLWKIKRPSLSDLMTIVTLMVTVVISLIVRARTT